MMNLLSSCLHTRYDTFTDNLVTNIRSPQLLHYWMWNGKASIFDWMLQPVITISLALVVASRCLPLTQLAYRGAKGLFARFPAGHLWVSSSLQKCQLFAWTMSLVTECTLGCCTGMLRLAPWYFNWANTMVVGNIWCARGYCWFDECGVLKL